MCDTPMADNSDREEDTTTSGMRKDTDHQNLRMCDPSMAEYSNRDPYFTNMKFLTSWNDYQLLKLTKLYWDRLEQAIEEDLDEISSQLTYEKHLSGQEHQKVIELMENGNRADSSKLLLNLVMGKGSVARKMMWECFVNMRHRLPKLDKILNEIQELGLEAFEKMNMAQGLSEVPSNLKAVQQKHKEALQIQTETMLVAPILIKEKVKTFQLVDQYTELTLISAVRNRTLVEHELLARGRDHDEWREKHLQSELEKIRIDHLFQSSFSWVGFLYQKVKNLFWQSSSGSSAVVSGVPGIGKTTMVQKIVYDWAVGIIYPHFQFVFSFKFRDLNTINGRINLRNLILDQYSYFGNVLGELWKNPEGLLFIFDGLDEFKDRINFSDNQRSTKPQYMCTDPECWCEVSDIVYSLIQHKLLPGCSVLVTTRPTALHLLEKAEISVWAEIMGFVGDERKEYFNNYFKDQNVAAAVFRYVKENEIMYTMCYNPSYCWILALSLGPFFTQRDRRQKHVPKTITQLYAYYIYNILENHGREIENPRDVLLKLGEMAFTGVSEKKIVFTNEDLIQYNLQPSQFLSGFLMELLERHDSVHSVVYTFPHLTIQEFVAALAQFLTSNSGDMQKILSDAHRMEDGRFEIYLRFVIGLSSPQSAKPLTKVLGPFCCKIICQVIDWVKEVIGEQIRNSASKLDQRNLLNTLHYMFESQNKKLLQEIMESAEKLKLCDLRLTPVDYLVLSHVIDSCDSIRHLDMQNCYIQYEGLQRLNPVLHKCRVLRLSFNEFGDSGVKLLSAALRNPDCKIEELSLEENNLTDSCAGDLAFALNVNRSLTVLYLGNNKLGDSGLKLLSVALRNPNCKIQKLHLADDGLSASCVEDLISVLSTNQSLTSLDMSNNKLNDSGVKLLSAALRNPDCIIHELILKEVGLTTSCADDLASTLSASPALTILNLGYNKLGDSGVKALSEVLGNPNCKVQKLRLSENGISASSMKDLACALSSNCSLIELDLGHNKLCDSGVKLLSAALGKSKCKIQKLRLDDNRLSDSCTGDLASALNSNCTLTELNLEYNSFTDKSVPALCRIIINCTGLARIELWENKFSSNGKNQLQSLQGTRRGLNVVLSAR
ncbi:NACHT, LRR and PYD domains-containing protein 3-like isoform X1 [Stegostoma tigrinum]|uniref:NACHT, LRR and PYD domains-containing protein 3-like isoform X1 n=2 Tax=Stegostoma tigrinum TaxID=3053191 RepID=UPI002870521F|nr:NACHT, LRR and PYD domains-containing protein 3-like isoform X1 [Stegostoma tigrinum]